MQATLNVFADMHVLPASLDPALGLVLPEPSIDTTLPTSKVDNCVTGVDGQFETCHGSAMDGGGGVVASVEWSTDDGATWHPVGGMAVANELGEGAARFEIRLRAAGVTMRPSLLLRAFDDSGNMEAV
jgi:hypothetical protein